MGNGTPQIPRIELPGAEYFALAPGRTVAIQGRRRGKPNMTAQMAGQVGGVVSFAASATGQNFGQIGIESNFPPTSGIYIHYLAMIWSPQDAAGMLTVAQASVGFGIGTPAPGFVMFAVGIPSQTNGSPIGTQNVIVERDVLLTGLDITGGARTPGDLYLQCAISSHNNDAGAAHTLAVYVQYIYSRADGFVE